MAATRKPQTAADAPGDGATLVSLPVADLVPTPDNKRRLDEQSPAFLELVESVRAQGVLVPVHVRPHPDKRRKGKFDLRAGMRRHRAATLAGLAEIPCILHPDMDDRSAYELTLMENWAREDLTPLEESETVAGLLEIYNGDRAAVASRLGKSPRWVALRCRLRALSPKWREELAKAEDYWDPLATATAGHLELIARFDAPTQDEILETMRTYVDSGASIADWQGVLDEEYLRRIVAAPWDAADATLVEAAGACTECPKRSSCQGLLFHETEDAPAEEDRCLDKACWERKRAAWLQAQAERLKNEHPDLAYVTPQFTRSSAPAPLREETLTGYDYTEVTPPKSGKGKAEGDVKPALVVDGPDAGKRIWISTVDGSRGRGMRSPAQRGSGKPTPLKDRRKTLESKRWHDVLQKLQARVSETALDDIPLDADPDLGNWKSPVKLVLALARSFGTNICESGWGFGQHEALLACAPLAPEAIARDLWFHGIRPVLVHRLEVGAYGVTQTPDGLVDEGKRMSRLLGIDLDPLYAAACETYPEPKAWRKLNADGSKKTTKKKATQKRARTRDDDVPSPEAVSAALAERPRVEIADGPTVVIVESAGPDGPMFALWRVHPDGDRERLPRRHWPDRSALEDAVEDLEEFFTQECRNDPGGVTDIHLVRTQSIYDS